MAEVYFSIGTNSGDRQRNIADALERLSECFGSPYVSLSDIIETEPWGFSSEEKFLNCAVRYDLQSAPEDILSVCKKIEADMGRKLSAPEYDSEGRRVYKSRIIDIDILLYGETRIDLPHLKIPHPQMKEREFVMLPLSEIISDGMRDFLSRS